MANSNIASALNESQNEITNDMVLQIKNNYLLPLAKNIEKLVKKIELYIGVEDKIRSAYNDPNGVGSKQSRANVVYNSSKIKMNIQDFYKLVTKQYYQIRKDITGENIEDVIYVELKQKGQEETVWREVRGITLEKLLSVGKVNFTWSGSANIDINNAKVRRLMYTPKTKKLKKGITVSTNDYAEIFRKSAPLMKDINKKLDAEKNTTYLGKIVPYLSNGTVAETIRRLQVEGNGKSFYNLTQEKWIEELQTTAQNMKSGALGGDAGSEQIKAATATGASFHIGSLDELGRKLKKFHDQVINLSNYNELKRIVEIFFLNNFDKKKIKNEEKIDKKVLEDIDKTLRSLVDRVK